MADVLLITVDTARADRFSYAGGSPVPTPNIDALAAEGTAFLQAVSPAPITLVAHASLLTGLLPPDHGLRNNGAYRLGDDAVTLAELLVSRGYRTGAFIAAAVLDRRYGLDQGFAHYDDRMGGKPGAEFQPQRPGGEVVEAALSWLRQSGEGPTFVWVHLFDPHMPYAPPEPERSLYPEAPYAGEIAYADRVIGELVTGYRRLGLWRQTIMVFTSDHGESLGQHGEPTHGIFLFDETVRVPLVVRIPGLGEGLRIDAQAQLVDIVPTLGELIGLAVDPAVSGRSLLPLLRGEHRPSPPAYLETFLPALDYGWFVLRGLRTEERKLIVGRKPELYDLRADPGESRDLAASEVGVVRELAGILRRDFPEPDLDPAAGLQPDPETRARLAALGYLSAGPEEGAPGRRWRTYAERRMQRTVELSRRGFVGEARARCDQSADPGAAERCHEELAAVGAPERAPGRRPPRDLRKLTAAAEEAARRRDDPSLRQALTELTALVQEGVRQDHWTEAEEAVPSPEALRQAAAMSRIGSACFDRLSYDNALHAYLIGSRLVPQDAGFRYNLGLTWERLGEVEEAAASFRRALDRDPGFAKAESHLRYMEAVLERMG